ncbi:tRNA-splicing endonuclease, subunit Sen54, N-terminal [Phytophthora cinnamomi]|uniref:tRNA-splicing endonuclease, subunit Sen54, N-terminal n=1 Tax=Phytophthora cinnamomi TaxID=4785 RepID=UPI00355A39DA|nr:tRNA-splicing endonuclease, subunit Sen54, N-terminal [Phytophthora cinnamomi]
MVRLGKDVSVGEFDAASGLTHITQQRGRLLFNMGASLKRRQRREAPPLGAIAAKAAPPPTSTGAFTGLSLYPEEANYLLQRGALVVHLLSPGDDDAKELSVAEFTALLARDTRVSLACMEVYTFLKDQKLHPRRCLEPSGAASNDDGRSVPRHFVAGEPCDVAFDVWKTVAVDVHVQTSPPTGEADSKATTTSGEAVGLEASADNAVRPKKQKQRKKLALVFRVVVCRFGDAAPGPRSLRQAIDRSNARGCANGSNGADSGCSEPLACVQIPVKLAVVHHDQSALLFEISSSHPAVPS